MAGGDRKTREKYDVKILKNAGILSLARKRVRERERFVKKKGKKKKEKRK